MWREHIIQTHGEFYSSYKSFKCDQCGKEFVSKQTFDLHSNVHFPKRYKCKVCDKRFNYPGSLRDHNKEIHGDVKTYTCKICEKPCLGRRVYVKHLESQHKNTKKKFKCDKCDLSFTTPSRLKIHEALHNNPKFPCADCEMIFRQKKTLTDHVARVHDEEDVKKEADR